MPKRDIEEFIAHWAGATAPEQAISQQFLGELCDLLDVPPPGNQRNGSYTFEFHVRESLHEGGYREGRIDLYKRACFVLESKKFAEARPEPSQLELSAVEIGASSRTGRASGPVRDTDRWDDAMLKALVQAERYTRALPADEPYPPFVLVVDVGHVIEVRADFSLTGRAYQPFPDPLTYRIRLEQLRDEKIRARLKLIWTQPLELDPARRSAEVTREVAKHLAELAKSLEQQGHAPKVVAEFLTRCLFCMFAEDVGLLPNHQQKPGFTALLHSLPANGDGFVVMLRTLFQEMNEGRNTEISLILRSKLLKFNGGLFADNTVLPVNGTQLGILKKAAELDWQHVEPAIFGTLLERALGGEGERHKLGAHFTPRAYVERLVLPTLVEPLRDEWENVRAAAISLAKRSSAKNAKAKELLAEMQKKQDQHKYAAAKLDYKLVQEEEKSALADLEKARAEIDLFHERLCSIKVLDPACGSGNFLYVALEHLKRLEGEVINAAADFGENFKLGLEKHTVDPHQFLGLEINPRAAALAELVLWIGYLQWHFRTRGQTMPAEPVLKKFNNIECRDAVLAYDGEPQPALDASGKVITVWDRRSHKTDMLTGRQVPDETKRVPLLTYTNPRPATWPTADFIVGNPPFIGKGRLREDLGDGYAETLRAAYPEVPESADFVMYWWYKAAELVRTSKVKRFGLITTNSISQTFARRVVQGQLSGKPPLSLIFAIPDHPWVDTAEGAAVRIAMTVGISGEKFGDLMEVADETQLEDGSQKVSYKVQFGKISGDLTVGADVSSTKTLKANQGMTSMGVMLAGRGFMITQQEASVLGAGKNRALDSVLRPIRNGRDMLDEPRHMYVIDFTGLSMEEARIKFPALFQILLTRVKPERDQNRDMQFKDKWWLFGRSRPEFRAMTKGLRRYIATVETAKHRLFEFLPSEILPEHKLIMVGTDDGYNLGVLSSRIHTVYALAAGGWIGYGNDPVYAKSRCFDPFPFPLCGKSETERIRQLAEELDAHRKRAQEQHGLTLTGLYNVLEKIRSGEPLTDKEKLVHDKGLVSVLKQLHDDLDAAVFAAYGWPATLTDAEILERLVALNAERAAEEQRGVIHWLRPDYQSGEQKPLNLTTTKPKPAKTAKAAPAKRSTKLPWPKGMAERVQAIQTALHAVAGPITPGDLAKQFAHAKPADVAEILKTLETLGRARRAEGGKYRA